MNLVNINKQLAGESPANIVSWGLSVAKNPVVPTNFRPFEGAILQAVLSPKGTEKRRVGHECFGSCVSQCCEGGR